MTSGPPYWCSQTKKWGHVGVPNQSSGNWTLFSCKTVFCFSKAIWRLATQVKTLYWSTEWVVQAQTLTGTLCCVLEQDMSVSQWLFPPRTIKCVLVNRLFAWHSHVTLSIIKNDCGTGQMLEIKRACQKYESGKVWGSEHCRVSFYGTLNFWEIWRICMKNIAGEQTLLAIHFVSRPFFMIDKVMWPCHAKSLLLGQPGASHPGGSSKCYKQVGLKRLTYYTYRSLITLWF